MNLNNNDLNKIEVTKKRLDLFHSPLIAWIILILSLILTVGAFQISNKFVRQQALTRFNARVNEVASAIETRMQVYESVLRGGASLFYASKHVDRYEWRSYVENLHIDKYWPGIQGLGFSVPVKPEEKDHHIQSIQSEGFPEYTIKPEGERDEYSAIVYLEPFDWRNQRAFGYDMWSNDMRRQAMARARDTGEASASGMITLVQETDEDVQKGFLLYLPLYKKDEDVHTVDQRRDHFEGWVYCAFRVGDLMKGILDSDTSDIAFEIYDGLEISQDTLLYDNNSVIDLQESKKDVFHKEIQLKVQGRLWTVYFKTSQDYFSDAEANQPRFIALGGVIIDFLLFYVIYSMYFLQHRATVLARKMTSELEQQKRELETTKDSLAAKVRERTKDLEAAKKDLELRVKERTKKLQENMSDLERSNKVMVGRELRMTELKEENEKLKKMLGDRS